MIVAVCGCGSSTPTAQALPATRQPPSTDPSSTTASHIVTRHPGASTTSGELGQLSRLTQIAS
jgi:hypothetical protein